MTEEIDRKKAEYPRTPHKDVIHQIACDYHGRRIATCSSDMTMAIWDRMNDGTWNKSAFWKVHGGAVWRVIWAHPQYGQVLATCSLDRSVHVWEEQRGTDGRGSPRWVRKSILTDSRANVTDIAFSPTHLGLLLATCSTQGTVRVYEAADVMDITKWSLIHELQAFYTRCGCITWSKSRIHRPLLCVASDDPKSAKDERIVVYEYNDNLRKWSRVVSVKMDLPHPVTDIKFSPIALAQSHQLAVAAGDIHIFTLKIPKSRFLEDENGQPMQSIPTQQAEYAAMKAAVLGDVRKAWRMSYNVTGTIITASSSDGTIRFWKALFVNQWALLSEVTTEEYMEEIEQSITHKGYLSEGGKTEMKKAVYY